MANSRTPSTHPRPHEPETAQRVQGLPPATRVTVGRAHARALVTGGQVYCWGEMFGYPSKPTTPERVAGVDDAVDLTAGFDFTRARLRVLVIDARPPGGDTLSRILTCAACIVAGTATTRAAHADAPPLRVHLDYHAVAGCPDAAAFQRAVAIRAPEVRFEDEEGATAPAAWVVTVTRLDAGAKGELSLDGGATVRTIEGESCASVVTALSVVAALGAREAAAAPAPPPILEPTTQQPAEQAPLAPPPAPHWRPAFGFAWLVQSAGGALGPSLLVGFERETTQTAVAPSLRLYGARIVDAIPDRSFGWWLVGLQGCALRIGLSSAFTAHLPCLDMEGGSLASSGFSADRSRPWLAAGVSARVGLSLTRALRLEGTGTALVPVTRDTFLNKPGEEAYRADVLLVRLAAGATLTLP